MLWSFKKTKNSKVVRKLSVLVSIFQRFGKTLRFSVYEWTNERHSRSCCRSFWAASFENLIQCAIIFRNVFVCRRKAEIARARSLACRAYGWMSGRTFAHLIWLTLEYKWNEHVEHIIVYLENTNWMRETGLTEMCSMRARDRERTSERARAHAHASEWSKWSACYVHYFEIFMFIKILSVRALKRWSELCDLMFVAVWWVH